MTSTKRIAAAIFAVALVGLSACTDSESTQKPTQTAPSTLTAPPTSTSPQNTQSVSSSSSPIATEPPPAKVNPQKLDSAARWKAVMALPTGRPIDNVPRVERVGRANRMVIPAGEGTKVVQLPESVGVVYQVVTVSNGYLLAIGLGQGEGMLDTGTQVLHVSTEGVIKSLITKERASHLAVSPDGTQYSVFVLGDEPNLLHTKLMVGKADGSAAPTFTGIVSKDYGGPAEVLAWTKQGVVFRGDDTASLWPGSGTTATKLGSKLALQVFAETDVSTNRIALIDLADGKECLRHGPKLQQNAEVLCANRMRAGDLGDARLLVQTNDGEHEGDPGPYQQYVFNLANGKLTAVNTPAAAIGSILRFNMLDEPGTMYFCITKEGGQEKRCLRWNSVTGKTEYAPFTKGVEDVLLPSDVLITP